MKDLYFSHDRNAMNDNKIDDLRGIYGMEGYGVYWAVVEALSREPDLSLEFSERKAAGLSASIHPTFDMMEFLTECVSIGLFVRDDNRFWSESLRRRIKSATEISQKRRNASMNRWNNRNQAPASTPDAPADFPDVYDKEWKRVMEAYGQQIGVFPMGKAGEILLSFYNDLGADAMVFAIERTNQQHPNNPYKFLKAMLDDFADNGVHDRLSAEVYATEYDRRRQQAQQSRRGGSKQAQPETPPAQQDDGDDVRWLG